MVENILIKALLLPLLLSLQSCPTLWDPIDGSPPGSPVPGILQARTLEWVVISFSNAWKWKVKGESEVAQSYLTLRDPMDCSLSGSFVHGIFQARVLEWVAIAFSNKSIRMFQRMFRLFEFTMRSHIFEKDGNDEYHGQCLPPVLGISVPPSFFFFFLAVVTHHLH